MPHFAHRLRHWDVSSAARVDGFAANLSHVADRIRKYWRREAAIVHPPVAVTEFRPTAAQEVEDFYLWAGELAPYKRPDIAIDAFRLSGLRLVIAGGPETARRALAERARGHDNITFAGRVSDTELRCLMARCRALIFPGEEEFGIIPVEVMASGRPVIAYGFGSALDTVVDGHTGLLFHDQSAEGLAAAVVERFEAEGLDRLDPAALLAHARRFDEAAFRQGILHSLHAIGAPLADTLDKSCRAAAS